MRHDASPSAPEGADEALVGQLERSRELGFLGPGPVDAHIDHARRFAAALEASGPGRRRALDLGSGGGLPGLVLVSAWPTTDWCLLDANQRRTEFLQRGGRRAGPRRAGDGACGAGPRSWPRPGAPGQFDLVVARSFGRPAVTAECAAGFLAVGGTLVVSEPPDDPRIGAPVDGWATVGSDGPGRCWACADSASGPGARCSCATRPVPERYPPAGGHPRQTAAVPLIRAAGRDVSRETSG